MTKVFKDPSEFADDQLEGFARLYSDRLTQVPGGVVSHRGPVDEVAVVIGGGSGHYPAFAGLVGPGLATAAVVGNIFTSPSVAQAYSVAKNADQGKGVIFSFGNYAGDVLNFGIAAKRLNAEGIDTRIVLVTDDVASSDTEERLRGIAGDFMVFKAMGAAKEEGTIDDVERIGRKANYYTRSFGVAFSGCTMPGADQPLFEVAPNQMGVGLGIHGEPGIKDVELQSADDLARTLVDGIMKDVPVFEDGPLDRVAVTLNGLGTTKYEELFLLWNEVAPLLEERGLVLVAPEVGELVTSLDMGGCSLSVMWMDDELERLWIKPAYTPAFRRDNSAVESLTRIVPAEESTKRQTWPEPSEAGKAAGDMTLRALDKTLAALTENADLLAQMDSVAGDGDHGRGMLKGITGALAAVEPLPSVGASAILRTAGRGWGAAAGGTSGVLWGAGLEAAGAALDDNADSIASADVLAAVDAFVEAIAELGGATVGDRTILDSAIPFRDALKAGIEDGQELTEAWSSASSTATDAAEKTASLSPKLGRARPLAEKSIGHADPGATSFAIITEVVGE